MCPFRRAANLPTPLSPIPLPRRSLTFVPNLPNPPLEVPARLPDLLPRLAGPLLEHARSLLGPRAELLERLARLSLVFVHWDTGVACAGLERALELGGGGEGVVVEPTRGFALSAMVTQQ
jgi:hypothetical protein